MKTNEYIDHKSNKLGVEIREHNHGGEIAWEFDYNGKTEIAYTLRQLEDALDDCLDGGWYRQAEAEVDRSFAFRAYGE